MLQGFVYGVGLADTVEFIEIINSLIINEKHLSGSPPYPPPPTPLTLCFCQNSLRDFLFSLKSSLCFTAYSSCWMVLRLISWPPVEAGHQRCGFLPLFHSLLSASPHIHRLARTHIHTEMHIDAVCLTPVPCRMMLHRLCLCSPYLSICPCL